MSPGRIELGDVRENVDVVVDWNCVGGVHKVLLQASEAASFERRVGLKIPKWGTRVIHNLVI